MKPVFLNSNPITIVLLVIALVVIAVLAIIISIRLISNKRIEKQVNELNKKYESLYELLTERLEKDLKRVYEISQENIEYEYTYNINYNMYQAVLNQENSIAQKAIEDINRLLIDKKYKLIKDELELVKNKINDLEIKCNQVSESVSELITVDDENRQELLRYRCEFSSIKDEYELKKNELRFIESSFVSVFDKMEEYFSESEKLLLGAHYVESKKNFPEMERAMKALKKSVSLLPKLCTLTFIVVPNNVEELNRRYNEMVNDGYPLHHLKFQQVVDIFEQTLETLQERLKQFSTKNVEFELNQIKDAIMKITVDLDNEVKARDFFKSQYEEIYYGSNKIENKFMKLRKDLPKYKETYLLKDSCVDDLDRVEKGVNNLALIKRTLDTYIHSSSTQPYSSLAERLNELLGATKQIEDDIDSIQLYLSSLKEDTNNGYKYFTTLFIELKKCEAQIRKFDVPSVTYRFNELFSQCYDILQDCGHIINNLPINVSALNENVEQLKICFEKINTSLNEIEETIYKAEQSVVYANQYRQGFDDVKATLVKAEKSFFEGDFARTNSETINMIKKIRPESGK